MTIGETGGLIAEALGEHDEVDDLGRIGPPEVAIPALLMLRLWFIGPRQHAQTMDASAGRRSAHSREGFQPPADFRRDGVMPERRDGPRLPPGRRATALLAHTRTKAPRTTSIRSLLTVAA
jgi:hypothetical protein